MTPPFKAAPADSSNTEEGIERTRPMLALDTSVPTARVAVLTASGECLARGEKTAARHSSNLLKLCDDTLREAGVSLRELGAIACGAGPGSFTGLRVGMAVAKGLALPTGLPLLLVSSLEALAHDLSPLAPVGALLVPCIDAGKEQVYSRLYKVREEGLDVLEGEWALSPDELCSCVTARAGHAHAQGDGAVLAGGNGVDRYLALFQVRLGEAAVRAAVPGPSALSVGMLALRRFAGGESDDLERAVPAYGRPPDITRPKRPPPSSDPNR